MFYEDKKEELNYKINESILFGDFDKIALIENEEDERFWNYSILKAIPDIRVQYHSYFKHKSKDDDSEYTISQGKQQLYKFNDIISEFEGDAIICIDSDFDYINNNFNINENPYIIQTYVYSVENYICCAKSLNELKSDLLFPYDSFDFEKFFTEFSLVIADITPYHILLKENEDKNIKSVYSSYFSKIPEFSSFNDLQGLYNLCELKTLIDEELKRIKDFYEVDEEKLDDIKKKLENDTLITNLMLHMHISGHLIFELVQKIFIKLNNLTLAKDVADAKIDYKGEALSIKVAELKNKRKCIYTALSLNYNNCLINSYCNSFKKIIDDIKTI